MVLLLATNYIVAKFGFQEVFVSFVNLKFIFLIGTSELELWNYNGQKLLCAFGT